MAIRKDYRQLLCVMGESMRKIKEQMTFSYVHYIIMMALCRLMLEGLTSVSLCAPIYNGIPSCIYL